MHERENALKEWLATVIPKITYRLTPLAGDASFRRYFRIQYNGLSQIIMDAPPEKEALEPFVTVANTLAGADVITPAILAMEMQQGFLLLSDLGNDLLLDKLNADSAPAFYHAAMHTLLKIQNCSVIAPKLPVFNQEHMLNEMNLCPEWFIKSYLKLDLTSTEIDLLQTTLNWIANQVALQPKVFIHRDYHSRNLMVINSVLPPTLGVIDFQDAMSGPITYDLVSLLKDCYISWPRDKIIAWVTYFYNTSAHTKMYSLSEFIRAFDLCGLQRHLKVLGIFSRLYLRDHKPGYLDNLPLTLRYVLECCQYYPELHSFGDFLQKRVYLP